MRTIEDVKVGEKISNKRNGEGMVTHKTAKTITVQFTNGNKVKNTYRHKDAYFYQSEF